MVRIFTYIYHKINSPNVGKYTVRPMDGMGIASNQFIDAWWLVDFSYTWMSTRLSACISVEGWELYGNSIDFRLHSRSLTYTPVN